MAKKEGESNVIKLEVILQNITSSFLEPKKP